MTFSGLVASRAVKAYLAASDSVLSLVKRKRAAFLFWKIFSTAVLSKGRTAALMAAIRQIAKIMDLVMCWLLIKY